MVPAIKQWFLKLVLLNLLTYIQKGKKSSASLHVLKNNWKVIKDNCRQNASELK